MRNSSGIDILAGICLTGALATILFVSREPSPGLDRALHTAIGRALAKETLSLLGPGGKITLISRDTETFRQPALEVLLKSFQREIRHAHVSIAKTQLLQTDPLRPIDVPSGDFFELLRRCPPGDAIVSLLGPPFLTPEQRNRLGPIQPKIVAFSPGPLGETTDLRQLFNAGLLHSAVVIRQESLVPGNSGTRPPRSFEELYTIVRATDTLTTPAVDAASPNQNDR
jgi:hypothetical protein